MGRGTARPTVCCRKLPVLPGAESELVRQSLLPSSFLPCATWGIGETIACSNPTPAEGRQALPSRRPSSPARLCRRARRRPIFAMLSRETFGRTESLSQFISPPSYRCFRRAVYRTKVLGLGLGPARRVFRIGVAAAPKALQAAAAGCAAGGSSVMGATAPIVAIRPGGPALTLWPATYWLIPVAARFVQPSVFSSASRTS
jgi:hypothetical protein